MKNINKILFLILLSSTFYCSGQDNKVQGYYINECREIINLKKNNSYEYFCKIRWDVGPVSEDIYQTGFWTNKENSDTLLLSSAVFPSNYSDIIVNKECLVSGDSVTIILRSFDTIPLLLFMPSEIQVDGIYYNLIWTKDFSYVKIKSSKINCIVIPGYPFYKVKNDSSNYFDFSIKQSKEVNLFRFENEYFFNRKYYHKGNKIFYIKDNKVYNETCEFIKCKPKGLFRKKVNKIRECLPLR